MQLYDYKQLQQSLLKKFEVIQRKMGDLKSKINSLEQEQQTPEVWKNLAKVTDINRHLKVLKQKETALHSAENLIADLDTAIQLAEESPADYGESEILQISKQAENLLQELWIETLLSGEFDAGAAIISLHAGAGGEEAQDWAEMLSRMYTRYCDLHDYKYTLLDTTPGDGAGIKSQTYLVEGDFAYGYLKTEKGVHRLVRLSPFDANNRRHTSFASLEVSPFMDKPNTEIKINPNDIKIDTYRSSGAGGQHVNKTESAIRLTHAPTGIVVACQDERSQTQNREMAMKMLISKLIEKREAERMELDQDIKGEIKKIEWGSQIRSYVFCPYTLVKDHRTGFEITDIGSVMNGNIQGFINDYLKKSQ